MKEKLYNQSPAAILKSALRASVGLFAFGFCEYVTIKANIGVGPWEAFTLGLSGSLGLSYGTVAIAISFTIVFINILLKERIGFGMLLDAVIVGLSVDFFLALDPIPACTGILSGLAMYITAIFAMEFTVWFYMEARLGCGPRDCLMIALGKRLKKVSIGTVLALMMITVTVLGFILGGPIGIGTVCCAVLSGPFMQIVFRILKFDATGIVHQSIFETIAVFKNKDRL